VESLRRRVRANLARFEQRPADRPELRAAAVALALLPDASGEPCFLLTRRAAGLRQHAGQFALPGGSLDAGETPEQAALREMHEEVGLELVQDQVLGRLDDYVTRSGYLITPVVVCSASSAELRPNPSEVASAHLVPLRALDHPDVPRLRRIPETERPVLSVPLDDALGVAIHAPTAALLFQLREVALHGRSTRVAHYDAPVFAWR
jgi:mutator protein MutT